MTPTENRDEKTPDDRLRAGARSDDAGISASEPQTGTTPRAPETDLGVQGALPENTVVPAGADTFDVIGEKKGMFGVQGSGDTSGYGGLSRPIVMPGASPRPYGGWFDEVIDRLVEVLGPDAAPAVEKVVVHRGEMTIFLRPEHLLTTVQHLRDDALLRFEFCSGVSGVHYPGDKGRELHAVYHLLSMTHNRRIRLEVAVPEAQPHLPSVVAVYPTADWHEREAYDFFGILFDGHPSLTRIMMPDDWPGHPQRKDYPLGGVPVEYKGATIPPPDTRRSYL